MLRKAHSEIPGVVYIKHQPSVFLDVSSVMCFKPYSQQSVLLSLTLLLYVGDIQGFSSTLKGRDRCSFCEK